MENQWCGRDEERRAGGSVPCDYQGPGKMTASLVFQLACKAARDTRIQPPTRGRSRQRTAAGTVWALQSARSPSPVLCRLGLRSPGRAQVPGSQECAQEEGGRKCAPCWSVFATKFLTCIRKKIGQLEVNHSELHAPGGFAFYKPLHN